MSRCDTSSRPGCPGMLHSLGLSVCVVCANVSEIVTAPQLAVLSSRWLQPPWYYWELHTCLQLACAAACSCALRPSLTHRAVALPAPLVPRLGQPHTQAARSAAYHSTAAPTSMQHSSLRAHAAPTSGARSCYFTSESHIHSLVNVLRLCHLLHKPAAAGAAGSQLSEQE